MAGQGSAEQCKGQDVRQCRTQRTAEQDKGHDGVRDRVEGRADGRTGSGQVTGRRDVMRGKAGMTK